MNTLLAEAFEKAQDLPDELQSELAKQLLEDIENEAGWIKQLSQPQSSVLETLAGKALQESEQSLTYKKGFDEL